MVRLHAVLVLAPKDFAIAAPVASAQDLQALATDAIVYLRHVSVPPYGTEVTSSSRGATCSLTFPKLVTPFPSLISNVKYTTRVRPPCPTCSSEVLVALEHLSTGVRSFTLSYPTFSCATCPSTTLTPSHAPRYRHDERVAQHPHPYI